MGVLKIIFLFVTLIMFPFGETIRIPISSEVGVSLNDIGVGLIAIVFVFWCAIKKRSIGNFLLKPFFIFVFICLLSLAVNIKNLTLFESFASFLYLLRWVAYAVIYLIVINFDNSFKKKIVLLMTITGIVLVLIGYMQYFFYSNLRNLYYLGWDDHLYRMFSSFLDPNFAGAFFVLFLIFNIGILIQSFSQKISKVKIFGIGIVIFLTLGAIYLTFSRSALLMLFTGVFIELALFGKKRWIFLLIGISLIVFLISSKNFYIENINPFRIISTEARLTSAKEAIAIFKHNPLLGVGFNAYRYSQVRYGFKTKIGARTSHADAGTDNSFLFVLATTGIVGLAFYLYMWFKILHYVYNYQGATLQVSIRAMTIASIIGVFVDSLFINSLFYPFIMMWMWILIGVFRENR